ncbi:MAG: glycosyltransferase family 4 protein [bacterium]
MAKIVIVLNTAWNVWNFRLPLLKHLESKGHTVVVLAPEDEYTQRIPFKSYSLRIKGWSKNPVMDSAAYLSIYRALKNLRPDVLLLYTVKPNIYGNMAAKALKIKTISNIAGLGAAFQRKDTLSWLVKELYRHALKWPSTIFFQNPEDLNYFRKEGVVNFDKTELLPGSGVDLARFDAARFEAPKEDKIVFLLAARMLWSKGIREFSDAAKVLLHEGWAAEFRLLGVLNLNSHEAITQDRMDALCAETGVVYRGVTDCVEDELAQVHCVVLPTYYPEGTPRALLEAGSMSKPIITTDMPGCRNVVEHGVNGYLCAPGNVDDLVSRMRQVLELTPAQRNKMGQAGRQRVEARFNEQFVIDAYEKAIDRVLEEIG